MVKVVPAALKSRKGNPNAIGALSAGDRVALLTHPTSRVPVNSFAPFGGTTDPFTTKPTRRRRTEPYVSMRATTSCPWITALAQTEGFVFEIGFRRHDLFIQVGPGLGDAGFHAKGFARLTPYRRDPMRRPGLQEPLPRRDQAVGRNQDFDNHSSPVSSVRMTRAV